MAKDAPDRITVSFPPTADIDAEKIDELVAESECESRSEWIRKQLADASDIDGS